MTCSASAATRGPSVRCVHVAAANQELVLEGLAREGVG